MLALLMQHETWELHIHSSNASLFPSSSDSDHSTHYLPRPTIFISSFYSRFYYLKYIKLLDSYFCCHWNILRMARKRRLSQTGKWLFSFGEEEVAHMKMVTDFEGYDCIRHLLAVLTASSKQEKKTKCDEGDSVTSSGPTSAVESVNKNPRSKNLTSKNPGSRNPTVSESPARQPQQTALSNNYEQASANCGKTENFPSDITPESETSNQRLENFPPDITAELEISNQGLEDSNTELGEDNQEHWPDQLASGSVCSTSSALMDHAGLALDFMDLHNYRTTPLAWLLNESALKDVDPSFDASSQEIALNSVSNTILAPIQSEPAFYLTSATTYIGNQTLTTGDAYIHPSSTLMIDHFEVLLSS